MSYQGSQQHQNTETEKKLKHGFQDSENIYKCRRTWELWRAYFVFSLCGIKTIMENNQKMMEIGKKVLGGKVFEKLMKASFYGQFVGGETMEEVQPVIDQMKKQGVNSIIDYSAEEDIDRVEWVLGNGSHRNNKCREFFYQGEAVCDKNMEMFLESIDIASKTRNGEGFCAVKMTALGRPEILLRMSEIIDSNQIQLMFTEKGWIPEDLWHDAGALFQLDALKCEKIKEILITGDDKGLLLEVQEEQLMNMMERLHKIFSYAKERKVRVLVDAEQSFYQPAINKLTMRMMRIYNKDEVVVFNTYQCYLKNALNTGTQDLEQARSDQFYFGAKLVRGAYMDQEREMAKIMDCDDPINIDYDATTNTLKSVISVCLERIKDTTDSAEDLKKVQIMVATHNEDTVMYTLDVMDSLKIDVKTISFAQLFGMCDHVTFPLGHEGYMVYKYVPYGPVMEVLPYLSRRVTENGSVLTSLEKEKRFLRRAIWNRLRAGEPWSQ